MTTTTTEKAWDFSQVLKLINTLDANPPSSSPAQSIPAHSAAVAAAAAVNDFDFGVSQSLPNHSPFGAFESTSNGGVRLGDFDKVWEYLGAPLQAPIPKFTNPTSTASEKISPTLRERVPVKTDYTSDGAVYLTPSKKSIQWRDEASAGGLFDVAPSSSQEPVRLTKTQRKKKNRQERKKLGAEALVSASDFESEADDHPNRFTPARKASVHTVVSESPTPRYNLRSCSATAAAASAAAKNATPSKSESSLITPVKKSPESFFEKRERSRSPTKQPHRSKSTQASDAAPSTPAPKTPLAASRKHSQPITTTHKTPATDGKNNQRKEWPVVNLQDKLAQINRSPSFLPASVKPTRHTNLTQPTLTSDGTIEKLSESPSKHSNNRNIIKPKIVRTGEDRDLALLLKLVSDFYEDRGHLVKPANLANHSNNPKGIHVFVDASNIFIGFHDQLKRSRDIPQHFHVPRVNLSFGALALLMERRRPIAKRVLVGSKPNLLAFDTAREIGYECSLLDKVLKARELTDRQKYFQEMERKKREKGGRFRSGSNSGGESGGSGLETTSGPVYAPEAFVEQGVDEILHLKMMESIVDTEEPSTMVLATGDAAQAEYSQGFMKMTQRALKAGWRVELVSWSKNISQAYKKSAFRKEWGDKFKIVELDDYAEELLDM
ncbi:hypothetical protein AAFC00_001178 [Neodothiora populina]|uniref:NYN domain-containing protein n=1 Tax=Neodothiora populina TaxID=2781224 RepID=A0ABR3PN20_9PEZI